MDEEIKTLILQKVKSLKHPQCRVSATHTARVIKKDRELVASAFEQMVKDGLFRKVRNGYVLTYNGLHSEQIEKKKKIASRLVVWRDFFLGVSATVLAELILILLLKLL